MFLKDNVPTPVYKNGATVVFDRMLRQLEAESCDKKRLSTLYNRNLRDAEYEKRTIENKLNTTNRELDYINSRRYAKKVLFYSFKISIKKCVVFNM